ncbi:MAG: YlbF family regulator [Alicyclobacillaceae bacterium]|nr:YlbF family regulator [Alicyclobacillaceae bacterium]
MVEPVADGVPAQAAERRQPVDRVLLMQMASDIAREIATSEIARRYWQARRKMEHHERAQALFEELKLKKNTSLILQQRLSPDHPKVLLAELEVHEVEQKLQEIPVAMQYKEAQAELNDLMQGVVQVLLARLAGELPVEVGPRQGCGRGHGGEGCGCGRG